MSIERPLKSNDSPIVKCSHCKSILSAEDFKTHKCNWTLNDVKRIPVVYFRDDSYDGKKIMSGYGINGILYTFIVTPRTAIPYFKKLSDDSYHDDDDRRKVTRTV